MTGGKARVRLRNWRESDLPFLLRLRNDVPLQARLLSTARGSDETAVRAWLARKSEGEGRIFRVIADPDNDQPLGYLQADRSDGSPDDWSFGICIAEAFQGGGAGTAALQALEVELSDRFGARNLRLEVDVENERAIRCYDRLGYARTGSTVRQVIVCGETRDVVAMSKPVSLTSAVR